MVCYTICKLDREKNKLGIKNKEQEFERYVVHIFLIDNRDIIEYNDTKFYNITEVIYILDSSRIWKFSSEWVLYG